MRRLAGEVDEVITVVEYDPRWPALFEAECVCITDALRAVVTRVEHFGSTAIPGMAGKPIVDLLVGVGDLGDVSDLVDDPLDRLGYQNFGEIFFPGRLYLRKRGPPHFNVAITKDGSEFWNAQIIVRDYLLIHPDEVARYSAEKRSCYSAGACLFSTYSQSKGPFLEALKDRAERWHQRSGRATP
jgi:GrpB-like predicted nucleotidyltransferase (UPF0157 family)